MKFISVNLENRSYPIIINDDDYSLLGRHIKKLSLGNAAFIVTNPPVHKLYASKLKKTLSKQGICAYFHKISDSEKSKSIAEYIATITKISSLDTKKKLFLIAFGGGVVGDLCGFVAATYKRGVNYVQVPTTLLAQVDSAIGGKTAIDLPSGKNLVGAFFQPRLVYSNVSVLNSLPARQIRSGLAEVVKYGIIADPKLFTYIENNCERLLCLDRHSLEHVVTAASAIKAHVVTGDETESKGFRTILNYGHTIGHALETAAGYTGLNHGEAISIGMICAAEIAAELGILSRDFTEQLLGLLRRLKLPEKAPRADLDTILAAFYRDKKFINGKIRMVLPTRIGHVIVAENIPINLIKKIMKKRLG